MMNDPVICPNELLEKVIQALDEDAGDCRARLRVMESMLDVERLRRIWTRRMKTNERLIAAIRKRQAQAPHVTKARAAR